jgi:hypothetical protein
MTPVGHDRRRVATAYEGIEARRDRACLPLDRVRWPGIIRSGVKRILVNLSAKT